MTRHAIQKALRKGLHPRDLGARLLKHQGVQRESFVLGRWIIKSRRCCGADVLSSSDRAYLLRHGLIPIRSWRAEEWLIQPRLKTLCRTCSVSVKRYRKFHKAIDEFRLDIHEGNVGFDSRNRLVIFDW